VEKNCSLSHSFQLLPAKTSGFDSVTIQLANSPLASRVEMTKTDCRWHVVARQNSDLMSDQVDGLCTWFGLYPCKTGLMLRLLRLLSIVPTRFFRSRCDLLLENLALRQQLGVFKRKHPGPRFAATDKLFWVMLRRLWAGWSGALILVQPETVVRWHRKGFKLY
jgi:hypothetical protein